MVRQHETFLNHFLKKIVLPALLVSNSDFKDYSRPVDLFFRPSPYDTPSPGSTQEWHIFSSGYTQELNIVICTLLS